MIKRLIGPTDLRKGDNSIEWSREIVDTCLFVKQVWLRVRTEKEIVVGEGASSTEVRTSLQKSLDEYSRDSCGPLI